MKTHFLLPFIALLGCAASGCSTNFACTLIGCEDSITVDLPGLATKASGATPLSIKVCIDGGACTTAELTEAGGVFKCEVSSSASVAGCSVAANGDVTFVAPLTAKEDATSAMVAVTATDSAGAKVLDASKSATLASTTPNGEGCDPVCVNGTVSISG